MSLSGYADPSYGTEDYGSGGLFFGSHGMPRCSCWISFTTNPGDAPVWEDVSPYLRAFTVKRGRQYELDQFAAGTATITLNNQDRRFDPSYTSSPYYPNVLPMRRIQIRATWGVDYTVFDGYVDGWPQSYQQPHEARVDVTATDAFKVLELVSYPQSVYEYEVLADSPVHWWRLNERQGTAVLDSARTSSPVTGVIFPSSTEGLIGYNTTGSSPYDSDTALQFTDPGDSVTRGPYMSFPTFIGTTAGPWSIEFWAADIPANGDLLAIVPVDENGEILAFRVQGLFKPTRLFLLYTDSAAHQVALELPGVAPLLQAPGWHHLAATYDGAEIRIYLDLEYQNRAFSGVLHPSADQTESPSVFNYSFDAGAVFTVDEIAFYDSCLSADRIVAHVNAATDAWSGDSTTSRITRALDYAGFSSTARNLQTGIIQFLGPAVLGGQTIKDHVQQVEFAEAGQFFIDGSGNATLYNRHYLRQAPGRTPQAVFGDAAGEQMYADIVVTFDDTHIVNDARITRAGGTTQIHDDAASQAKYLKRTLEQSDVHSPDDTESLYRAEDIVGRYKDPALRVESITVKPQRDPSNLWPLVLGLDLMDVITAKRRPQAVGSAISQDVAIESVSHTVTPESWVTTYQLGQLPTQGWVLEDATYGVLDSTTAVSF